MYLIRRLTSSQNANSKVVPGSHGGGFVGAIAEDRDMGVDDAEKELLDVEEDGAGGTQYDSSEGFEDVEDQLKGELLQQEQSGKGSKSKTKAKAKITKKKAGGKKGKKAVPEPEIEQDEETTQAQDLDETPDAQLNAESQEEVVEEEELPKKRNPRTVNGVTPRQTRASRSQATLPPSKPEEDPVKLLNEARMAALAGRAAKTPQAVTLGETHTQTQNSSPPAKHSTTQKHIYNLPSPDNLAYVAAKFQKIKKLKTRRTSDVRAEGDAVFSQPLTPTHVSHHGHKSPESESAVAAQLTGDIDAMAPAVVEGDEEPRRASKKALGKRKTRDELAVGSDADEEPKRQTKKAPGKRKVAQTVDPELSGAEEDEEPKRPSKKALGKRRAVDEPTESTKKRTKRTKDKGPSNGDIKNMFSSSTGRQASPVDEDVDVDPPEKHIGEDERPRNTLKNAGVSITPIRPPPSKFIKAAQTPKIAESPRRSSWNAINKPHPPEDDYEQLPSNPPDPNAVYTTHETQQPSTEASPEPVVPKSTASRKRRLPVAEPDPASPKPRKYVGLKSQEPEPKTPKAPKTPASKAKKSSAAPTTTGKLSAEDITLITDAVESYKDGNDLSQHEMNDLIQQNAYGASEPKEFWKSVYDEVPWIPTKKVSQFCRRKYHNFEARGKWTDEQDEELRVAHERNPGKWTVIGRDINRFAEDARDRWRNYLVCGDNMRKDAWDRAEENRLSLAVEECIAMVQAARRRSGGLRLTEDDETLIDWSKVSEKMDHTRSRLQCSYKWKQMKDRQLSDDEGGGTAKPIKKTWRLSEANDNARALSADEKLRLLRAIRTCGAGREGKIPWTRIRDDLDEHGKRMTWKVCFQRLKEKVTGHEDMKFSEILDELIDAFEAAAPEEPDGFIIDTPARKQKKALRASQATTQFDDEVAEEGNGEGPSTVSKKQKKFRDRMRREDQPTQSTQDTEVNGNVDSGDEAPPTVTKKRKARDGTKSKSKSVEPVAEGVEESEDLATSLQALKSNKPRKPRAPRRKAKAPLTKLKRAQLSEEHVVEDPSDDEAALPINGDSNKTNHETAIDNAYDEMDIDPTEQQTSNDDPEMEDVQEDDPEISHHDTESVDLDEAHTITTNGFHFNREEEDDLDQEPVKPATNGYGTDEEEDALNATQHDTESVDLDDTTPEDDSPGGRFRALGSPVAFESKANLNSLPSSDTDSLSSDASSIQASIQAKKPTKKSKKSKTPKRSRLERLESLEL